MRDYFFYSTILMSLFLISCSSKLEVDVSVINNSGAVVDSILISISVINQTFINPLPLGGDTAFVLDFSDEPKVDGQLGFSFYLHDGKKVEYSDYISNGVPLTDHYDMEVLPDTVKVK